MVRMNARSRSVTAAIRRLGRVVRISLIGLVAWVTVALSPAFAATPPDASSLPTSDADKAALMEQLDGLYQQALQATNQQDFPQAEQFWTQMLDLFPQNPAVWSNRGNSKVSQNKLQEAIADFNQAIALAPDAPDPYLNRGAAYEGIGQWEAAIADYNHVLDLDPKDPVAYNNRGSAEMGLGQWESAIADFQHAADLAPDYAFARANQAIALYQAGQTEEAMRMMRNLVRKYPKFADMRAALTAALWVNGRQGEAESEWVAAVGLDSRYRNVDWLRTIRRWPPALVTAMEKFLTLKSS